MAQLPNPHENTKFDEVRKGAQGDPEWGVRKVDGHEEIVFIPSGRSNIQYWQPEAVMKPEGCQHEFTVVDVGHREVLCNLCNYATTFHVGINYVEDNGEPYIILRDKQYRINR